MSLLNAVLDMTSPVQVCHTLTACLWQKLQSIYVCIQHRIGKETTKNQCVHVNKIIMPQIKVECSSVKSTHRENQCSWSNCKKTLQTLPIMHEIAVKITDQNSITHQYSIQLVKCHVTKNEMYRQIHKT